MIGEPGDIRVVRLRRLGEGIHVGFLFGQPLVQRLVLYRVAPAIRRRVPPIQYIVEILVGQAVLGLELVVLVDLDTLVFAIVTAHGIHSTASGGRPFDVGSEAGAEPALLALLEPDKSGRHGNRPGDDQREQDKCGCGQ